MPDPRPLSAADLKAIQKRVKDATRGPWDANGPMVTSDTVDEMLISLERYPGWEWDAKFIASARQDVPALLATVRAQAQEIARLRTELEE